MVPTDDAALFGTLQSSLHGVWAIKFGHFREQRLQYSSADLFQTFPLPMDDLSELREVSEAYHRMRVETMIERSIGLTQLYNEFHDQTARNDRITLLRDLHKSVDQALAVSLGISPSNLSYAFRATKQGIRHTLTMDSEHFVVEHLMDLNLARHRAEAYSGEAGRRVRNEPHKNDPLLHERGLFNP